MHSFFSWTCLQHSCSTRRLAIPLPYMRRPKIAGGEGAVEGLEVFPGLAAGFCPEVGWLLIQRGDVCPLVTLV